MRAAADGQDRGAYAAPAASSRDLPPSRAVSTQIPWSVTATEFSQWAARDPSVVTTVHPSGMTRTAGAAVGAIIGVILLDTLEVLVLKRLARLHYGVEQITRSHHVTNRLEVTGSDELASLGHAVNSMLDQLEKAEKELIEARDQALGDPLCLGRPGHEQGRHGQTNQKPAYLARFHRNLLFIWNV